MCVDGEFWESHNQKLVLVCKMKVFSFLRNFRGGREEVKNRNNEYETLHYNLRS